MKKFFKSIIVCTIILTFCCSALFVNAATTSSQSSKLSEINDAVNSNNNISDTNIDINSLSEDDLKADLDEKTGQISLSTSVNDLLANYTKQTTNETDILQKWNSTESLLNSIDFSDLSGSLSSFDAENGSLNYSFSLLASSLGTYQKNSELSKIDSNASVFKKGYSDNIKTYFKKSFGNLSNKKDLSLKELPKLSSLTKTADKKRKNGMSSFLNSSTYKSVNSAVSIGDIFSSAQNQLNGGGGYSLSSIGSLQNSISGSAASLDSGIESKQSSKYKSADKALTGTYNTNKKDSKSYHKGQFDSLKSSISSSYKFKKKGAEAEQPRTKPHGTLASGKNGLPTVDDMTSGRVKY